MDNLNSNMNGTENNGLKPDINNLETAKETKRIFGNVSPIKGMIAGLLTVSTIMILIGSVVGTNIHTCEECEEEFFGKPYEISFFAIHESVCKDCYDKFYN